MQILLLDYHFRPIWPLFATFLRRKRSCCVLAVASSRELHALRSPLIFNRFSFGPNFIFLNFGRLKFMKYWLLKLKLRKEEGQFCVLRAPCSVIISRVFTRLNNPLLPVWYELITSILCCQNVNKISACISRALSESICPMKCPQKQALFGRLRSQALLRSLRLSAPAFFFCFSRRSRLQIILARWQFSSYWSMPLDRGPVQLSES